MEAGGNVGVEAFVQQEHGLQATTGARGLSDGVAPHVEALTEGLGGLLWVHGAGDVRRICCSLPRAVHHLMGGSGHKEVAYALQRAEGEAGQVASVAGAEAGRYHARHPVQHGARRERKVEDGLLVDWACSVSWHSGQGDGDGAGGGDQDSWACILHLTCLCHGIVIAAPML
jgi:hypothetical protein